MASRKRASSHADDDAPTGRKHPRTLADVTIPTEDMPALPARVSKGKDDVAGGTRATPACIQHSRQYCGKTLRAYVDTHVPRHAQHDARRQYWRIRVGALILASGWFTEDDVKSEMDLICDGARKVAPLAWTTLHATPLVEPAPVVDLSHICRGGFPMHAVVVPKKGMHPIEPNTFYWNVYYGKFFGFRAWSTPENLEARAVAFARQPLVYCTRARGEPRPMDATPASLAVDVSDCTIAGARVSLNVLSSKGLHPTLDGVYYWQARCRGASLFSGWFTREGARARIIEVCAAAANKEHLGQVASTGAQ